MVKGSSKKRFIALVLQTLSRSSTSVQLPQRPVLPADLNLPMPVLKNIMEVAFPLNPVMLDYFATTKSKIRLPTTKITSVEELQKQ